MFVRRPPVCLFSFVIAEIFSEKSYEEIGRTIKNPVNTVGTLINRAKRKLAAVINLLENK